MTTGRINQVTTLPSRQRHTRDPPRLEGDAATAEAPRLGLGPVGGRESIFLSRCLLITFTLPKEPKSDSWGRYAGYPRLDMFRFPHSKTTGTGIFMRPTRCSPSPETLMAREGRPRQTFVQCFPGSPCLQNSRPLPDNAGRRENRPTTGGFPGSLLHTPHRKVPAVQPKYNRRPPVFLTREKYPQTRCYTGPRHPSHSDSIADSVYHTLAGTPLRSGAGLSGRESGQYMR